MSVCTCVRVYVWFSNALRWRPSKSVDYPTSNLPLPPWYNPYNCNEAGEREGDGERARRGLKTRPQTFPGRMNARMHACTPYSMNN